MSYPRTRRFTLRIIVLYMVFFFIPNEIFSQDLHYSQFYNSPLNVNPALTGIYNGDLRFMMSVRDQWRSVPVPWFTFSGAFDKRLSSNERDNRFWSVGFSYNYDRQGASNLNLNSLNLSASFSKIINTSNIITVGGLVGYTMRGYNLNTLTWDKQWDGERVNINLPSGEMFDLDKVGFIETGAGINYRWQKSNRTNLNLGVGAFHLHEPQTGFYETDDVKLPMRMTFSGEGSFKVMDMLDFGVNALMQMQGSYEEMLFGGLFKIHLSQSRGKENELHIGAGYRTSKFLYPTVALKLNSLFVGVSYDIDFTEFDALHDSNGGPEIHVRYIITNVKPLKFFKACPIF